MNDTIPEVKYPDCVVILLGTSTNAAAIIARVRKALRRHLRDVENLEADKADAIVNEFTTEASSGDYDNVLITCFRWVDVR